ncbi:MAG: alpha/beta hydrolase [bacterium]|nr:alpha/beta hydrolase [bacterium]
MTATKSNICVRRKSTNGRMVHVPPRFLVDGLRLLTRIWPGGTERLALWLFCRPIPRRVKPHQAAVLDAGEQVLLPTAFGKLQGWSWGEGPVVLLHHGWGGHAGQMTAFVGPLVDAGFRVVAYDAMAHGRSPGRITSGPDMARALGQITAGLGDVHAVVAHSIGSAATMIALGWGLDISRAAVLAPPADMRVFFRAFGEHLELSPRVQEGMNRRAEARFDFSWDQLDVDTWAGDGSTPLLVCHDEADPVVPFSHARRIADTWQAAELVPTRGLGHNGVRRDPELVARVVAYVARPAVVAAAAG